MFPARLEQSADGQRWEPSTQPLVFVSADPAQQILNDRGIVRVGELVRAVVRDVREKSRGPQAA